MSVRKKTQDRCLNCLMRNELCICDFIPRLVTKTKVVLVIGKREIKVPTNTGRLAAQALENSVILIRGDQDRPYDLKEHLNPNGRNLLLYPHDDAEELTPKMFEKNETSEPWTLVVPDGNWRQTFKMRHRDPAMASLRTVKIPQGLPSVYRVRKETKPEGLATIEAIARALGIIEGKEIQTALEDLMNIMVTRTLSSRGIVSE